MSVLRNGLQSADLDIPVVLPTLNLDFANSQQLDPRITFTRGSIGTFVNKNGLIETAAANIPRFDYDPISGECRGLLIEESRQNLLTYSNDFSQGVWSKTRINISSNAAIAPDGTNTAFKLYNDYISGNASHRMTSSYVASASLPTGSIFVKAAEYDKVLLSIVRDNGIGFAGGEVAFDLKTGAIITNLGYSGTTGKIEPYGNGWYRISIASTITATTNYAIRINLLNTFQSSVATYPGDDKSGIYIWGAQLESGAFPTSYIPTSASTVTRSPDIATLNIPNFQSVFPNRDENTFFVEAFRGNGTGNNPMVFEGFTASTDSVHTTLACIPTSNKIRGQVRHGNNRYESLTLSPDVFFNQKFRAAIRTWSRTDVSGNSGPPAVTPPYTSILAVNGTLLYNYYYGSGRSDWNSSSALGIGSRQIYGVVNYGSYWNNCICKIRIYPKALSNTQLQYLTQ